MAAATAAKEASDARVKELEQSSYCAVCATACAKSALAERLTAARTAESAENCAAREREKLIFTAQREEERER